jgi:hypothetical protein
MCRLIEIRSAFDPRFSTFESQKVLVWTNKIFRPPSFCFLFHSFLYNSQRAGTNYHFRNTSVIDSSLRFGSFVCGDQGLIQILSKILEQYLSNILEQYLRKNFERYFIKILEQCLSRILEQYLWKFSKRLLSNFRNSNSAIFREIISANFETVSQKNFGMGSRQHFETVY